MEELISKTAELIIKSRHAVALTGAGMSTESGIPDFRGPNGIWTKNPKAEQQAYESYFKFQQNPRQYWIERLTGTSWINELTKAQPNPGHLALAELEKMSLLKSVITQNIDNLHQKAGNSPEKVFELHGSMHWAVCLTCHHRYPLPEIREKLNLASGAPLCEKCSGILKPDVVFFGESLPPVVLSEAIRHSRECDLLIAVGSSLVVYPAAYMPVYAKEAGARVVIVNLTATSYDMMADEVINGKAGEVMSAIMETVQKRLS